jgi:hypothetical protein
MSKGEKEGERKREIERGVLHIPQGKKLRLCLSFCPKGFQRVVVEKKYYLRYVYFILK